MGMVGIDVPISESSMSGAKATNPDLEMGVGIKASYLQLECGHRYITAHRCRSSTNSGVTRGSWGKICTLPA